MDSLTFISSVIDILAWPIFLFSSFWILRKQLGNLINAISEATLEFKKGETIVKLKLNTIRNKVPLISSQNSPKEMKDLAQTSPLTAIKKAWNEIEIVASTAASSTSSDSPFVIANTLVDKNIFTPNEAEAFYGMYEISEEANKLVAKKYTDVSSASAYTDLAFGLKEKINASLNITLEDTKVNSSATVASKDKGK